VQPSADATGGGPWSPPDPSSCKPSIPSPNWSSWRRSCVQPAADTAWRRPAGRGGWGRLSGRRGRSSTWCRLLLQPARVMSPLPI
jgi:hypothetical protein